MRTEARSGEPQRRCHLLGSPWCAVRAIWWIGRVSSVFPATFHGTGPRYSMVANRTLWISWTKVPLVILRPGTRHRFCGSGLRKWRGGVFAAQIGQEWTFAVAGAGAGAGGGRKVALEAE